jgi:HK97 family phage prohead protease
LQVLAKHLKNKHMKLKVTRSAATKHLGMVGKTVRVVDGPDTWLGAVKSLQGETLMVSPALMREGIMVVDWSVTSAVHPAFAESFEGVGIQGRKLASWDEQTEIRMKRQTITDADGMIVDYKDVTINGYLSTFENMTPADRDGDYVRKTAFDKSIGKFGNNPVMLMDHINDIEHLAGSFTDMKKDGKGLAVVGKVSNAPELRKIRFLVAEKHLKTLSMGGLFLYGHDGKAIEEVDLWEGSLVPVPANQDARFEVRSFDVVSSAKALSRHLKAGKEVRGV